MSTPKEEKMWVVFKPMLQQYIAPLWYLVAGGVLAGVVAAAAAGFGLPFMIQYVFPVVFGQEAAPAVVQQWLDAQGYDKEQAANVLLWGAAAIIPLVMAIRGFATYANAYLLTKAGMKALSTLRVDIFARLQWLSFSYHDRNTRGDLMTAVIQYTQMVQQGLVTVLNDLVIQPLTLISAAAYLVFAACTQHESAMLLGNLIISAACIPVVRWVGKGMVKQMRKALSGLNIITSVVEETFSAQREVRAFNLEKKREAILQHHIRSFNKLIIKMSAWQQSVTPAVEVVSALALAYSLYCGCSDGLSLEQFTAIATAFYFCYDPIKRLGSVANQCQLLTVGIKGINDVLHAKDETPEPAEPAALQLPISGNVDFENVTFGYNDEKIVLKDINVHVPAGQTVALVGPSGSGKTTFINLICRFYDVNAGSVKLDGVDVRQITRADRTRSIGLVSQFAALFRDTILENIRVGRPGATDDAVIQAACMARVDEFADSHPDGYHRMLGEGGAGLSGGQRQRVSIARAFLKNAPVLILDEATSALDMKSEAAIQAELEELVKGHTTFVIAHRFSTIRMAERILVFEEGRIIADGTHAELYENCSLYRHLYDEQVRQAEEEQEKELAE
jgi:subfamily B ATP-binding cassette protein MsbA